MNILPKGDVDSVLMREYNNLFIKVNEWGSFEDSNIERNGLREYIHDGTVPDFVAEAERDLDSKLGLSPDVCCFLQGHFFDADKSM